MVDMYPPPDPSGGLTRPTAEASLLKRLGSNHILILKIHVAFFFLGAPFGLFLRRMASTLMLHVSIIHAWC